MKLVKSATFYRGEYSFSIPLNYSGDEDFLEELYIFASRAGKEHKVRTVKIIRATFDLGLRAAVVFIDDAIKNEGCMKR